MLDLEKRREGAPEPEAPADAFAPINIMCDPRVYRGTAFGKNSFKSSSSSAAASPGTPADVKDRTIKNRRVSRQARLPSIAELHQSIHVVLPHEDVPLRVHLEERLAPPVVHRTQTTQTDAFPDRPADPGYVPAKIGMDIGTQIADGDLFDLDEAMAPIVSVLVSKTLQQALIEVQMETELSVIAERKRNANLTEALRLEQIAEQEANARADAAKAVRSRHRSARVIVNVHPGAFARERARTCTTRATRHRADAVPSVGVLDAGEPERRPSRSLGPDRVLLRQRPATGRGALPAVDH
ncbi:hypothetical protein PBRA_001151 [Plasmodiophora brassicae]|uniref:Uncharacterized protein n=1 Tax=Plasmodiophora brassicae TaxID=37360 RepID=A0A0G4IVD1_PLABS|nr:hypothetical protein PBRA_001151 [Plasmodiophora brassicae]